MVTEQKPGTLTLRDLITRFLSRRNLSPRTVDYYSNILSHLQWYACQNGWPEQVKHGALSFLGYRDDYVWIVDADLASTPWSDKAAATCLMPVIDSTNALLDGKTSEEAFYIELEGYLRNAAAEEDELIKSLLEFNRKNAVLLGDGSAKVRARPPLALPFRLVPPPPIIVPL